MFKVRRVESVFSWIQPQPVQSHKTGPNFSHISRKILSVSNFEHAQICSNWPDRNNFYCMMFGKQFAATLCNFLLRKFEKIIWKLFLKNFALIIHECAPIRSPRYRAGWVSVFAHFSPNKLLHQFFEAQKLLSYCNSKI